MPTYEYQCKTCRQHFERVQRFSDAPITECPHCGGEVRRVIHPAGVIFKGTGWYKTDSRKGGDGEAKSDGGEAKKVESTSDSADSATKSSETKPAEKATAASKD